VLFEYQAAVAGAIVLAYLLVRTRAARDAALFVAGAVPSTVALAASTPPPSARRCTSRTAT
jgi:hypothetical protein